MTPNEFRQLQVPQQIDVALSLHFSNPEWIAWEAELEQLGDGHILERRDAFAQKLIKEERAFAREVLANKKPVAAFPRDQQYAKRYHFEIACLEFCLGRKLESIAVIGSGAFPVTCIALANSYRVTGIELDEQNFALGKQVAAALNSSAHFSLCDAAEYDFADNFDALIVAGTAGTSSDAKLALIDAISLRTVSDVKLLIRDSMREEKLILPHLQLAEAKKPFECFQFETRNDYMRRIVFST